MWLWKKFNNLNTTSKVIILILVILLIIGITSIILINYKKVENIPLQNDAILSSSLNIEENINEVVDQETINNEIKEEKDIQENNSNAENKQAIQSNNTNNALANTSKNNNNVSNQTNNKQENNKQENNKTEINKETNNQTNTPIKNEQPTGNAGLANTHFRKYNKEKTNHAVAYLNNRIKQADYYEIVGGEAIAVTEKPCKDWFSYLYDEKLNSLVVAGCTIKVYIEDEYAYDSKGINYYLYDTKAYIYTY